MFDVSRKTYYEWLKRAEQYGLSALLAGPSVTPTRDPYELGDRSATSRVFLRFLLRLEAIRVLRTDATSIGPSHPPSTGRIAPRTWSEAREARNTAAPAMSVGRPQRFAGMRSRIAADRSGSTRRWSVTRV